VEACRRCGKPLDDVEESLGVCWRCSEQLTNLTQRCISRFVGCWCVAWKELGDEVPGCYVEANDFDDEVVDCIKMLSEEIGDVDVRDAAIGSYVYERREGKRFDDQDAVDVAEKFVHEADEEINGGVAIATSEG